ncbi:MAG: hypothetical protein WDM90_21265 [Ferruginibacter sp.]
MKYTLLQLSTYMSIRFSTVPAGRSSAACPNGPSGRRTKVPLIEDLSGEQAGVKCAHTIGFFRE